jgi:predicted ATPase
LEAATPAEGYPFELPAVRGLPLVLTAPVSVLVGDNGTGKSTLIEAIAVAAGFNAEGGSGQVMFETVATHSELTKYLRLIWSAPRLKPGFFLRAESFYNVASYRDAHPGRGLSYHAMSHGESFLEVARTWFRNPALFILDEPEAALSFHGQLALIHAMLEAVPNGAQFLVATHSPLLMALPNACLFQLDESGITTRTYDDLEVVALWRSFLDDPARFLRHLGTADEGDDLS